MNGFKIKTFLVSELLGNIADNASLSQNACTTKSSEKQSHDDPVIR